LSLVSVLSGRGVSDGPIPRRQKSYRLWCVSECDHMRINNLDTCCEQVEEGRTAKLIKSSFLSVSQQPDPDLGRLTVEISISHAVRCTHSVELSWKSDQPVSCYTSATLGKNTNSQRRLHCKAVSAYQSDISPFDAVYVVCGTPTIVTSTAK
jgi:hypothetical protein